MRLADGGSKWAMGDVFNAMWNEIVKCIAQDIVDTKGLWGLEKQLEKFLGKRKPIGGSLPCSLGQPRAVAPCRLRGCPGKGSLCPCSGLIPSLGVCWWPCHRWGAGQGEDELVRPFLTSLMRWDAWKRESCFWTAVGGWAGGFTLCQNMDKIKRDDFSDFNGWW